jgi:hypothetical protein
MTENDAAWQKVFEALDLASGLRDRGFCCLTADELKAHGRREPRLMAKMDTLRDRPAVFEEHQVNLFPVRNGRYVLFKDPGNRTYFRFGGALDQVLPQRHFSPIDLGRFDTFPAGDQVSESQAIDFAFVAGLLQRFFGEAKVHLTIRGRLFSERFAFRPPAAEQDIEVSKVQIEVDAGYEGADAIFLLEAKVGRRDDFNIRQLYYPFLNWSAKSRKRIVPIFLTFTNGQYFLTEFAFAPRFGDLSIVRTECWSINDSPIADIDWPRLFREVACESEAAPFPQADDLDKVVDLVKLAGSGLADKTQFAEFFEFDERQGDYYANAAKYLGLLERDGHGFQLTELGAAFNRLTARAERTTCIARQFLKRPALRRIVELLAARNYLLASLGEEEISGIIAESARLNPTTARRRALTARVWMAWLLKNSRAGGG